MIGLIISRLIYVVIIVSVAIYIKCELTTNTQDGAYIKNLILAIVLSFLVMNVAYGALDLYYLNHKPDEAFELVRVVITNMFSVAFLASVILLSKKLGE